MFGSEVRLVACRVLSMGGGVEASFMYILICWSLMWFKAG